MSAPQLLVLEMLAGGRIGINDAERLLTALKGTVGKVVVEPERAVMLEPIYADWAGNGLASVIPIHH